MSFFKFLFAFAIPSIMMFILAFWIGSQESIVFALTGFLGCFLISVSLFIEGWKKYKTKPDHQSDAKDH